MRSPCAGAQPGVMKYKLSRRWSGLLKYTRQSIPGLPGLISGLPKLAIACCVEARYAWLECCLSLPWSTRPLQAADSNIVLMTDTRWLHAVGPARPDCHTIALQGLQLMQLLLVQGRTAWPWLPPTTCRCGRQNIGSRMASCSRSAVASLLRTTWLSLKAFSTHL